MKNRNELGITLVALIVTIIVLIILAVISINVLFGENGLISIAQEATRKYKEAEEKELEDLTTVLDEQPSTAKEIISKMQLGWSLGNTFDSHYNSDYTGETVEDFETHWGNPITTKRLIYTIKSKGFNTLRIPITWYQHLDAEGNIDSKWLARIKEVVDYGIENKMYVILNTHHETWFTLDGSVSESDLQEKINKIWKQIANEFKDYNYKLLFEILNEPRSIDAEDEWKGNTTSYAKLNRIEKSIIETIRNTGGNNEKRCLLVPSYAANISKDILNGFEIPQDDYIIVALHDYTPSNFTKSTTEAYNNATAKYIDELYSLINDFQKKHPNVSILLGETGCYKKDDKTSHIKWAHRMMSVLGKLKIPCIMWDSGNNFKLIDRNTLTWEDENYLNTIFTSYKKARENNNSNQAINMFSNMNEETINISSNQNTESLTMKTQIQEGIRHFTISTTSAYTGGSQLRFKFSDTYALSGNDYYKITGKIKTNMSELKLRATIHFYDENDNLLYTGNSDNITSMIDGSKNEYEIAFPYYVEGAKKVQLERLSISSSYSGIVEFDLYDLQLVDN